MKIIEIPRELEIVARNRLTGEVGDRAALSFTTFLRSCMDMYQPESRTLSMLRQAAKVDEKIETMNGNLVLEDAECDLLQAAVKASLPKWATETARQIIPYFEAVEAAHDVKEEGKEA